MATTSLRAVTIGLEFRSENRRGDSGRGDSGEDVACFAYECKVNEMGPRSLTKLANHVGATSSTRLVLPMPPLPRTVTIRSRSSCSFSVVAASSRPISRVINSGSVEVEIVSRRQLTRRAIVRWQLQSDSRVLEYSAFTMKESASAGLTRTK